MYYGRGTEGAGVETPALGRGTEGAGVETPALGRGTAGAIVEMADRCPVEPLA